MGLANSNLNKQAPEFALETTLRDEVELSVYRNNNSAIMFFWATWCPHCQTALMELEEDLDYYESQDIKIIAVNIGEPPEMISKYLNDRGIDLEVFLDVDAQTAERYSVTGVPVFFFLDRMGVIKGVAHSIPEDIESLIL